MVAATGVGEATLRAWERRFGFPSPRREPSGHRRYSRDEVERIRAVVRERDRGLSLAVAIERVTAEPSGPPSLFAPLRERRPDLLPVSIRKPQMLHLSRAVEEESAARAERALMIGAFQRPEYYRAQRGRAGSGSPAAPASPSSSPPSTSAAPPEGGPVEVPIHSRRAGRRRVGGDLPRARLLGLPDRLGNGRRDRRAPTASAPSTRCSRSSRRWSAKWRAPRSGSPPRANRRSAERGARLPRPHPGLEPALAAPPRRRDHRPRLRPDVLARRAIRSSRPTRARRAAG